MIKVTSVLALAGLALGLSTASFAGSPTYGVTNDDNPGANTATAFKVTGPSSIGAFKTLNAGGSGLGGGYFASPRNSIEQNVACVFVSNAASSTIAAFAKVNGFAPSTGSPYAGIGNSDFEGMGLAASADGKYLFAAFSGSDQIGSYSINQGPGAATCALTPLSGPISASDAVAPIAINQAGTALIVSELDNEFLDSYAVSNGVIASTATSHVSTSSCGFPGGIDVTVGGSVVVGEATLSQTYMTDTLTGSTLGGTIGCNSITGTDDGVGNLESPVFNKAAYATGNGLVFMGFAGFGGGGAGSFADAGFSVNQVSSGAISPAVSAYYDAYEHGSNTYLYGTNPGISTVGSATGVWQSYATSSVTNIVTLYKVVGSTITPFASVSNPNANGTSFVLSISSFPTR